MSRAFAVSTSGGFSSGTRFIRCTWGLVKQKTIIPTAIPTSAAIATFGERPSVGPAAATISGDGVTPSASAAASGSPPGRLADSARADAGRILGSGSRQRRMARSTVLSKSPINVEGLAG